MTQQIEHDFFQTMKKYFKNVHHSKALIGGIKKQKTFYFKRDYLNLKFISKTFKYAVLDFSKVRKYYNVGNRYFFSLLLR